MRRIFAARRATVAALCACALLGPPRAAASDALFAEINALRTGGCGRPGAQAALDRNPALDRAASALAAGDDLRAAMSGAGYRATKAAMLEVTGTSEAAMANALAKRGCKDIGDPAWREAGLTMRDGAAWIVLAAPLDPPVAADAAAIGGRILALVNAARTEMRRCGRERFDPAPPLAPSAVLDRAAFGHARDMAARSTLGHAGGDGSTPAERATRAGYAWRLVGENVAAGQSTADQVVADWLASPQHCANLMDPDFTEMGIGFAADAASAAGIYWAQLFGAPRA